MKYKKYRLDDLLEIKYGKDKKTIESEDGKYPIFGTGGLMGYTNIFLYDQPSILIGRKGTISKVKYVEEPFWTVDTLFWTKINNKIVDPKYLYYKLLSINFNDYNEGTTIPSLRTETLNRIEIEIPDLETQKKVVKVLSILDQKIELNNQQNNTLFNIIKSIFRQQFYQKGSDCSLSDYILTEINGDWGKDKKENGTEKVYCIRGADIPGMEYGHKGNAPNRFVLEKRIEKKSLSEDDIIIEISGGSPTQSTGRTAYITQEIIDMYDAPLLCTNFCKAIKVKDRIFAPFIYMYLKLLYEDDILFNWENGTTGIKNLALSSLLFNIKVQSFSEKEVKRFYDQFYSIVNKISKNSAKNMNLVQMRDTLLPKLMSGEINLRNIS